MTTKNGVTALLHEGGKLHGLFNLVVPENVVRGDFLRRTGLLSDPSLVKEIVEYSQEVDAQRSFYSRYYQEKTNEIFKFFMKEDFKVAHVLFEYLLKLKGNKWRKNGFIPDEGHEIDQLLPLMRSLQSGDLKEKRAEIEARYGSIEKWFISIIVHDIGEDFPVFAADLKNEIQHRVLAKGWTLNPHHKQLIERAGRSMERLSHYRKFSIKEFEKLVGSKLPSLKIGPEDVVPLPEWEDFFVSKMDGLKAGLENLQVFAKWNPKTETPQIVVTRYGKTPRWSKNPVYGPDWQLYTSLLAASGIDDEEDFYDILTKLGDRVHGIATRIAISPFSAESYSKYLDETGLIFSQFNIAHLMRESLYPETPLADTIRSLDAMMGALYTIGSIYLAYHPHNNKNGERGMSARNISVLSKMTGVSPIHISRFSRGFNDFYGGTDTLSHPLFLMARDLVTAELVATEEEHEILLTNIFAAFDEVLGFDYSHRLRHLASVPSDYFRPKIVSI